VCVCVCVCVSVCVCLCVCVLQEVQMKCDILCDYDRQQRAHVLAEMSAATSHLETLLGDPSGGHGARLPPS
jgi:hypothetical protein